MPPRLAPRRMNFEVPSQPSLLERDASSPFVLTQLTPPEPYSAVTKLSAIGVYFGTTSFPHVFTCHSIILCNRGYYLTSDFDLHDAYEKICIDFQVPQVPHSSDYELMNAIVSIPFEIGNSTPTSTCIMLESSVGGMFKIII